MSGKTKSAEIATGGIKTASQFIDLMSALMADLLTEAVKPEVGNVVCKAAKKMLDVVDMSHRHGNGTFVTASIAPTSETPRLTSSVTSENSGKIKCNQCDERISPRTLAEHKKSAHPIN